ncbi:MAG: hypothetical protein ACD_28C00128G0003 [uncultured bacterium]|nr:MAG: hypothetical protein ACD_28C00128G0003 [uncultured bacterium]
MGQPELEINMKFNKDGAEVAPIAVFEIDDSYVLGIYQGSISEFDILIKYRQRIGPAWSRIRTPKHIHWAVDILIKLHEDREKTVQFLSFLLRVWSETRPIRNPEQRVRELSIVSLLENCQNEIREYEELGTKGEYSVKFLILLAKLLMIQEKTNLETAYMFKKLLEALRKGSDIFSIVSTATHNRR